jgi:ArsR family transcriptional regulator, arsenate/arsenite/antimonite-responsive transcriptional repressor
VPPKVEPALAKRLETLTGEDAACCVDDRRDEAERIRRSPAFEAALLTAKAMADEKRLLVLALLKRRGELCACEVQAALSLTHATVSHHMSCLLTAGLVTCERRGKWAYYDLAPHARELVP